MTDIQSLRCPACGRMTGAKADVHGTLRILRHSDYRLLPMQVYPCPESEEPTS